MPRRSRPSWHILSIFHYPSTLTHTLSSAHCATRGCLSEVDGSQDLAKSLKSKWEVVTCIMASHSMFVVPLALFFFAPASRRHLTLPRSLAATCSTHTHLLTLSLLPSRFPLQYLVPYAIQEDDTSKRNARRGTAQELHGRSSGQTRGLSHQKYCLC